MDVGDSAFTNDDDSDGHVVVKRNVVVGDDVEDEDGAKLPQSSDATVCLVQPPGSFAQNVDEDVGNDRFLTGSPNATQGVQFSLDASNGGVATDSSSPLLKTTHVVIHRQTLKGGLVSPLTPLPPPTPATPNAQGRGFRYQWDQSAFDPVIPVRCKSSNGELHKAKFGSGMMWLFYIMWCYVDMDKEVFYTSIR